MKKILIAIAAITLYSTNPSREDHDQKCSNGLTAIVEKCRKPGFMDDSEMTSTGKILAVTLHGDNLITRATYRNYYLFSTFGLPDDVTFSYGFLGNVFFKEEDFEQAVKDRIAE